MTGNTSKRSWYTVDEVPWYERLINICAINPLEFANCFGVFYTLGAIFSLLFLSVWFTCPALHGSEQCERPVLFGYYIIANILGNLVCFHYFKRNNKIQCLFPGNLRDDGLDAEHTKYCSRCQLVVPKQAHHCPLCNYCVLRKDHHCFMVGGCVGFGNHRYFIAFLFWASLGAGYATTFTWRYLNKFYKPFWPFGWIDYIGPIALHRWVFFQHCTLWQLCVCMLFSIGFASTWGAGAFFVSQWFFMYKGRTMVEFMKKKKDRHSDTESFFDQVRMIFGPYFLLNFIFPMPWLKNRLNQRSVQTLYGCYLKDL